jgi:hypothetical protein
VRGVPGDGHPYRDQGLRGADVRAVSTRWAKARRGSWQKSGNVSAGSTGARRSPPATILTPGLFPRGQTMADDTRTAETRSSRTPWNKGKLTGPKPPLKCARSGRSGSDCNWPTGCATRPCSTSPAITSCAAATWSSCASVMSPTAAPYPPNGLLTLSRAARHTSGVSWLGNRRLPRGDLVDHDP